MLIEARRSYGQKHVRVIDDRYTVKLGTGVTEYEYRILKLLERLGTLPSPRPIDFFTLEGDCKVIVMSTLPGRERQIGHNMGSGDRVRLLRDVWRYMERTNEVMGKSKEIVWDTSGGVMGSAMAMAKEISDLDGLRCLRFPLLDGFINHPVELSNFVDEMSNHTPQISSMIPIQRSVLEHLGTSSPITTATAIATTILHPIRFCHMDLHPGRNTNSKQQDQRYPRLGTRRLVHPHPRRFLRLEKRRILQGAHEGLRHRLGYHQSDTTGGEIE